MRTLITGANGFLGSQIVASLRQAGHQVVIAVHNAQLGQQQFPDCEVIACDFNQDITPEIWFPRLKNIDAVVNCVGIFQQRRGQNIKAVHELAPCALFDACVRTGVQRVLQISALGVDHANVAYTQTKKAAEDHLQKLNIDWVILRPSFIYGAGSYGGSSLFRGMAALPWIIPVLGGGKQRLQPIHIHDLAHAVKNLIESSQPIRKILTATGPEQVTFADVLIKIRRWLNLGKAKILSVPLWMAKPAAKFGDWFTNGPINSTAISLLPFDNISTPAAYQEFVNLIGFTPRSFSAGLTDGPSHVQDRWHAGLYFLKPLLRVSIGLLWIGSGLIPLLMNIFSNANLPTNLSSPLLFYGAALLDIALGLATLFNWRIRLIGSIQIVLMLIYIVILTFTFPALWLQPFAPLLKNIPILVATLIMIAIAEDR